MALSFPNHSRSFDVSRNAVRFWGYDGALEISFFIGGDALQVLVPDAEETETGYVAAFDQVRDKICAIANRAYARASRGTFVIELYASDL